MPPRGGGGVYDFKEWELGITSDAIVAAMATLSLCDGVSMHQWDAALVALADQLRAVSMTLHRWVRDRPCPRPDLDGVLSRLGRSYGYAADAMETASRMTPPDWRIVDRERKNLYREVVRLQLLLIEETQREV